MEHLRGNLYWVLSVNLLIRIGLPSRRSLVGVARLVSLLLIVQIVGRIQAETLCGRGFQRLEW